MVDAARPRESGAPVSDNAAALAGVAQPTIGAKMMGTVIPSFVSSLIALMQHSALASLPSSTVQC